MFPVPNWSAKRIKQRKLKRNLENPSGHILDAPDKFRNK
jgi:hypothetical protein